MRHVPFMRATIERCLVHSVFLGHREVELTASGADRVRSRRQYPFPNPLEVSIRVQKNEAWGVFCSPAGGRHRSDRSIAESPSTLQAYPILYLEPSDLGLFVKQVDRGNGRLAPLRSTFGQLLVQNISEAHEEGRVIPSPAT